MPILSVVLYGCEIWSVTLKEKHKLRMFENRVLREIFGLKRGEVTRERIKLHNVEFYWSVLLTKYYSVIKSRRMRWAGHVELRNAYRGLVECGWEKETTWKTLALVWWSVAERKRPLGRPWRWWDDNIKIGVQDVEWEVMDWIYLVKDKNRCPGIVIAVMNFGFHKRGEFLDWLRNC